MQLELYKHMFSLLRHSSKEGNTKKPLHAGSRHSYETHKMLLWVERGDNMMCMLSEIQTSTDWLYSFRSSCIA